jgi:hypothetical protein
MDTKQVAKLFTDLCAKGEFDAAGQKFWSDDVVSLEPMTGDMARVEGRKGVLGKGEWWYANHTVHDTKTEGPYVHGNQFAVRFYLDVTPKGGQRTKMEEIALYTVANGKIVEERFFFGGE